jgi:hypothetical protein
MAGQPGKKSQHKKRLHAPPEKTPEFWLAKAAPDASGVFAFQNNDFRSLPNLVQQADCRAIVHADDLSVSVLDFYANDEMAGF